jgi:hypothetical protein
MKHILNIILATSLFYSCNFLGPVDSSIQTHDVIYSEKDIIGTWKLDKFSYEYLSKKEHIDSIYITFNKDSTFVLNNSIHLFDRSVDLNKNEAIHGKLDNIKNTGSWKITNHKNIKLIKLDLIFKKNKYQGGIDVFKKENEFQIWYFFGDPDTGERLRFIKEK